MTARDILEPCLYNHLGYGNLDGPVWFVGVEEGGAKIWRCQTLTMEESLRLRAGYELAMHFRHVWEDLYTIPLDSWKGATTWRFIAAYILSLQGRRPDGASVQQYVFSDKLLGHLDGDHFPCELMPLPKRWKGRIEPYQDIWGTDGRYRQEVAPGRLRLLVQTLKEHPGVRLLVCYERDAVKLLRKSLRADRVVEWTLGKAQRYTLWACSVTPTREVYLLHTPFFGQGQISYDGIWESTQSLVELLPGMRLYAQPPPSRTVLTTLQPPAPRPADPSEKCVAPPTSAPTPSRRIAARKDPVPRPGACVSHKRPLDQS